LRFVALLVAALAAAVIPSAADAGELFGGVFVHDVKTPLDKSGIETGIDLSIGYRGDAIAHLFSGVLQPYLFGALNSAGDTDYAAAGVAAKFPLGGSWFIRPGIGLAIHDGSAGKYFRSDKIAFGSRVLFEPELGIGTQLNRRFSLEATWIHMSHAQVFGKENPGIDNIGMRVTLKL
jgi:hypothetical protein